MSIRANLEDASVAYYRAHDHWKGLPDGPAKVEAKRARGVAHSAFLSAVKLFLPQVEKKPPER